MKKKVNISKKELSRKITNSLADSLPKLKPYYQNKYYVIYDIIDTLISKAVTIWENVNRMDLSSFIILKQRGIIYSHLVYAFGYRDAINKLDGLEGEFARKLYNLLTSYEKGYYITTENYN